MVLTCAGLGRRSTVLFTSPDGDIFLRMDWLAWVLMGAPMTVGPEVVQ